MSNKHLRSLQYVLSVKLASGVADCPATPDLPADSGPGIRRPEFANLTPRIQEAPARDALACWVRLTFPCLCDLRSSARICPSAQLRAVSLSNGVHLRLSVYENDLLHLVRAEMAKSQRPLGNSSECNASACRYLRSTNDRRRCRIMVVRNERTKLVRPLRERIGEAPRERPYIGGRASRPKSESRSAAKP